MDTVKRVVVFTYFVLPVLAVQAGDKPVLSDGISAPGGGRKGLHMPTNSLSVSQSNQPQLSPISERSVESGFLVSEVVASAHHSDSADKNAQKWMDSEITEQAAGNYLKKLEKSDKPEAISNLLAKYLSKKTLCLMLQSTTIFATTDADEHGGVMRTLDNAETQAIAFAYFNIAFSATANDPEGRKHFGKKFKSPEALEDRLKQVKFIKPKKLKVFKDLVAMQKANKSQKQVAATFSREEHKKR